MNEDIIASSRLTVETFQRLVKYPLQELLGGEIYSVEDEAQSGSALAQTLDQSASSDLLVQYQASGSIFAAASRILFNDQDGCNRFDMSITLRNSVNRSIDRTELNKLRACAMQLRNGIPALIPRFLCYARVFPKKSPTTLFDLIALETLPLVDHVFNSNEFDLPRLRRQMEAENCEEVSFDPALRNLAGIRTKNANTFVYLSKRYLDQAGMPYMYRKYT
ncbi:hypothetical protein HG421_13450 [Xanthomonas campestris pv. badrii]|uniref:Uncharacterized protein n=1 Tax=Xanthomonas campestris pv. badrii TaxID=149696 RepID=A0A7Z2VBJ6_XANCA|nr:hypothetical protein [Xanthomonas campestris]MCC4602674.1 hypothetical protein [Xanthomonas campestris pv. parthenii]QJD68606.1 hypothetical protein HG421_13450 [Xanthomonas campestris pv. badrii]